MKQFFYFCGGGKMCIMERAAVLRLPCFNIFEKKAFLPVFLRKITTVLLLAILIVCPQQYAFGDSEETLRNKYPGVYRALEQSARGENMTTEQTKLVIELMNKSPDEFKKLSNDSKFMELKQEEKNKKKEEIPSEEGLRKRAELYTEEELRSLYPRAYYLLTKQAKGKELAADENSYLLGLASGKDIYNYFRLLEDSKLRAIRKETEKYKTSTYDTVKADQPDISQESAKKPYSATIRLTPRREDAKVTASTEQELQALRVKYPDLYRALLKNAKGEELTSAEENLLNKYSAAYIKTDLTEQEATDLENYSKLFYDPKLAALRNKRLGQSFEQSSLKQKQQPSADKTETFRQPDIKLPGDVEAVVKTPSLALKEITAEIKDQGQTGDAETSRTAVSTSKTEIPGTAEYAEETRKKYPDMYRIIEKGNRGETLTPEEKKSIEDFFGKNKEAFYAMAHEKTLKILEAYFDEVLAAGKKRELAKTPQKTTQENIQIPVITSIPDDTKYIRTPSLALEKTTSEAQSSDVKTGRTQETTTKKDTESKTAGKTSYDSAYVASDRVTTETTRAERASTEEASEKVPKLGTVRTESISYDSKDKEGDKTAKDGKGEAGEAQQIGGAAQQQQAGGAQQQAAAEENWTMGGDLFAFAFPVTVETKKLQQRVQARRAKKAETAGFNANPSIMGERSTGLKKGGPSDEVILNYWLTVPTYADAGQSFDYGPWADYGYVEKIMMWDVNGYAMGGYTKKTKPKERISGAYRLLTEKWNPVMNIWETISDNLSATGGIAAFNTQGYYRLTVLPRSAAFRLAPQYGVVMVRDPGANRKGSLIYYEIMAKLPPPYAGLGMTIDGYGKPQKQLDGPYKGFRPDCGSYYEVRAMAKQGIVESETNMSRMMRSSSQPEYYRNAGWVLKDSSDNVIEKHDSAESFVFSANYLGDGQYTLETHLAKDHQGDGIQSMIVGPAKTYINISRCGQGQYRPPAAASPSTEAVTFSTESFSYEIEQVVNSWAAANGTNPFYWADVDGIFRVPGSSSGSSSGATGVDNCTGKSMNFDASAPGGPYAGIMVDPSTKSCSLTGFSFTSEPSVWFNSLANKYMYGPGTGWTGTTELNAVYGTQYTKTFAKGSNVGITFKITNATPANASTAVLTVSNINW